MRIRLIADIEKKFEHGCSAGEEFEAVLIHPRSTTVEFITQSNKALRAFSYEYEIIESIESDELD